MEHQLPILRTDKLSWDWLTKYPVWGRFAEDDSEMLRPITDQDPFALNCEALTIKAKLFSDDGVEFDGSICIERTFDEIYLIEVWSKQRWFGFNRHLPDLVEQASKDLRAALGNARLELFPLKYQTLMDRPCKDFGGTYQPFSADNGGEGFSVRSRITHAR